MNLRSPRGTSAADKSVVSDNVNLALPRRVKCGSICSCLGTDHWALKDALPSYECEHIFWCEKEDYARDWLHANVHATHTFADVMTNFVDQAPYYDIVCEG